MKTLLEGLRRFSNDVYPDKRSLFEELSRGQKPHTLMITCSDSRIDPNLVTQTEPGEIFVVRNAGNIVPPFGSSRGGEEASIEFAIEALGVTNIVICGHSHCGAMNALMEPEKVASLPSVEHWLRHAAATRRRVQAAQDTALSPGEENVLVQAENLKTHPAVSAALRRGTLEIFGWIYQFEDGLVRIYDPSKNAFVPSSEVKERALSTPHSLAL
jgi:carbonic anhydrase